MWSVALGALRTIDVCDARGELMLIFNSAVY